MFRFGGKSHLEEWRAEQVRGGALGRLQSSRRLWDTPSLDLTPALPWLCLENTQQWLLPVQLLELIPSLLYFILLLASIQTNGLRCGIFTHNTVFLLCHCSSLSPHFPLGGPLLFSCIFSLSQSPSTMYTYKHTGVFFQTNHLETFSFLIFVGLL